MYFNIEHKGSGIFSNKSNQQSFFPLLLFLHGIFHKIVVEKGSTELLWIRMSDMCKHTEKDLFVTVDCGINTFFMRTIIQSKDEIKTQRLL